MASTSFARQVMKEDHPTPPHTCSCTAQHIQCSEHITGRNTYLAWKCVGMHTVHTHCCISLSLPSPSFYDFILLILSFAPPFFIFFSVHSFPFSLSSIYVFSLSLSLSLSLCLSPSIALSRFAVWMRLLRGYYQRD